MIVYADTSLLVKRYITEFDSAEAVSLLAPPTSVGTSLVTRAEISAGLAKAVRIGRLSRTDAGQALAEFRSHWPHLLTLQVDDALVSRADELAWELDLRGYDAIHLASALIWQDAVGAPVTMATYDRQLWQAAQRRGLAAWPENLPHL
jgi:predicted nucleic acid-binding protein